MSFSLTNLIEECVLVDGHKNDIYTLLESGHIQSNVIDDGIAVGSQLRFEVYDFTLDPLLGDHTPPELKLTRSFKIVTATTNSGDDIILETDIETSISIVSFLLEQVKVFKNQSATDGSMVSESTISTKAFLQKRERNSMKNHISYFISTCKVAQKSGKSRNLERLFCLRYENNPSFLPSPTSLTNSFLKKHFTFLKKEGRWICL